MSTNDLAKDIGIKLRKIRKSLKLPNGKEKGVRRKIPFPLFTCLRVYGQGPAVRRTPGWISPKRGARFGRTARSRLGQNKQMHVRWL